MIKTSAVRFNFRTLLAALTFSFSITIVLSGWTLELPLQEPSAAEEILGHAKYLASEKLTGRGVDTPGIKLASDYIAGEFTKYGLVPGGDNGSYLQGFDVATGVTIRQPTVLTLGNAPALALNEDWIPLGLSGSDKVEAEVVFAGYGISAKDYGYDDYTGIDVKGKIVVVLRYEPPPKNDQSPFRKYPNYSNHAALRAKAVNARDHGAAGMILVDLNTAGTDSKELLSTSNSLWRGGNSLIAAQIKRRVAEKWLDAHGISLMALKEKIDREEKPASLPLENVKVTLQVNLTETRQRTENVVGILPGADPKLKHENIVIGAHYDHLGFGYFGTRGATEGQIHHGADDNASGIAVLLNVARRLSQTPLRPARTIVLVTFSAEELGLYGSRYFVDHSSSLVSSTRAMLNLDMVGRLNDRRVTVFGTRSAKEFTNIVMTAARELEIGIAESDAVGRSDHMSFYNRKIPALHFFTGTHPDYHRPSDTWDKLNVEGMTKISDLVLATALNLANSRAPMTFVSLPARPPTGDAGETQRYGAYLGSIPDFAGIDDGVRLAGVSTGSPAALAGLRAGDVIVKLADTKIQNLEDLTVALRSRKPGDEVEIVVLRTGAPVTVKATLRPRD